MGRFSALLKVCSTGELRESESRALREIVLEHFPDKFLLGDRVVDRGGMREKTYGTVTEVSPDRRVVKVALEKNDHIRTYQANEIECVLPDVFQNGDAVLVRKTQTIRISAQVVKHNVDTGNVQVLLAQDGASFTQVVPASDLELKPRILAAPSLKIFASWFHDVLQNGIGPGAHGRSVFEVEAGWNSFVALVSGLDGSSSEDGTWSEELGTPRHRVSILISEKLHRKSCVSAKLSS